MSAKVAISRAEDPYSMMEQSLSMINFEEKLKQGHQILVKPNLVRTPSKSGWARREGAYELTWAPEGDIVHRESIEALLNLLIDKGVKPENIIVGDAPGGCEAETVFKALGLYELCEGFGAKLMDLNIAPSKKVEVENGRLLNEVWIPEVVLNADLRINLGMLKVHGLSVVSLCLKNWGIGIPPGGYYGLNKASGRHRKGIIDPLPIHPRGLRNKEMRKELISIGQEVPVSKVIVDVCKAKGYDLGILEGLTIMDYPDLEKSSRKSFRLRRNNLMLASYDMAAIDAVGARILGFDPDKILHIKWSGEENVGITDLNNIDVLGEKIKDVEMRSNPLYTQTEVMLPPLV